MDILKTYPTSTATLAHATQNRLGEGPVWHAARQSFLWVDIEGQKVQELKWPSGAFQQWDVPQRIGMLAPYNQTQVVVALHDGLALFDLETGGMHWLADLEKERPNNRPNDGKCDSAGRLWLGTMHLEANQNTGALYCIDENRTITQHLSSLVIANGMAWTADNKYFYFIDSNLQRVDRYFFKAAEGSIAFDRTVINIPESLGLPDGMAIDQQGMLWVAQWGGFCVCRWNPETGGLLKKIEVPAPQVTSCTFGGAQMDVLFITTARIGLDAETLEMYPQSGAVFTARPGVKGPLPHAFKQTKISALQNKTV